MDGVALGIPSIARFATRAANAADAIAIAAVQIASWRSTYRNLLPASVLAAMDLGERAARRRELLRGPGLHRVAYDTTFGDVVGFCYAGASRRSGAAIGELYELYLLDRARSFGLGRELFASFAAWSAATARRGMVVWVLEANHAARRFYAAQGGRQAGRVGSSVGGHPVTEVSYVWSAPRGPGP